MPPIGIIVSLIIVIAILLTWGSVYFYNTGVARRKKEFLSGNPDLAPASPDEKWDSAASWMEEQQFEELDIRSYDGLKLHGYYLKAKNPTNKTVIIAHGYASRAKEMGAFAQFYHERLGFNVLMPDNRGHGQSEGNYIGFGWHDRKDYLKWIDLIIERNGKDSQIVLHGVSMGGATVLMTAGEKLPGNVKCIVSDCAYTSAKGILSYQMKRMYKIPSFPILQLTSLVCKIKSGYFFGEASALKQVSKAKVPVLFTHGGDDKFVPTQMLFLLYEKYSGEKKMFVVQKAGHGLAYFKDREGYIRKVSEFIDNCVGGRFSDTL